MIPQRIGPTTGQIAGFDPGQSTLDAFILNFFSIRTEEASTWPRLFATRRSSTAFDAGIAIRAQLGKAPSSFSAPRAGEPSRRPRAAGEACKGSAPCANTDAPATWQWKRSTRLAEVAELLPER